MTGVPPPTLYHRWLGWHAPAMRRAITVLTAGRNDLPGVRHHAARPRIRRTVLAHAILSYVFGVVIIAGSVNLISGLFRQPPP